MSFHRGLGLVELVVVTALAGAAVPRTAMAQVVRADFTLPYEVRWGGAMLPPGMYSITMASVRGPALIATADGRGRCLTQATQVGSAMQGQPTGLMIAVSAGERTVRSFNWREGGRSFVYPLVSRGKHGALARTLDLEVLEVQVAKK